VLEELEKAAREERKGLWVDPQPVPPWGMAKQEKMSGTGAPASSIHRSDRPGPLTPVTDHPSWAHYERLGPPYEFFPMLQEPHASLSRWGTSTP